MNADFFDALDALEKEKGISKEYMLEKIKSAIIAAVKRDRGGTGENINADYDFQNKSMRFYLTKTVVEEVTNPNTEIQLEEAKKLNRRYDIDDLAEIEIETRNFGRIAAKIGKNVIVQAINEAMDTSIVRDFEGKQNEMLTGVVERILPSSKAVILQVGRHEIALPQKEQIPNEPYPVGKRVKIYVVDVKNRDKASHGHEVVISRTHPGLVKRLFEFEIPEIRDGTVEIMSIAREAGSRTKIAVMSKDPNVDPVGACIGPKKTRINNILDELYDEKIDIIVYSDDIQKYIASALSPASVLKVDANEEAKTCKVVVEDDQLSLAIGKEGQNARLAAKLTGWKIDIKPLSQSDF